VPLSFETPFSKKNEMKSNKTCCAALLKRTKLNAVAAISQQSPSTGTLLDLIADLRAGEGRALWTRLRRGKMSKKLQQNE